MSGTFDDSGVRRAQPAMAYVPQLVVLLECDRPLAGSARYSLDGLDAVTFGRGAARTATRHDVGNVRTLEMRIPGRSLSNAHGRLVRLSSSWAIEDLESTNGIFVNGQRVARAVLAPNDLFELGHTFMRVELSMPLMEHAPRDVDAEKTVGNVDATLDPALSGQFEALASIATSDVPVIVFGESGTGKELVARWIHERTRRKGQFVAVNCGAIPQGLVESTLFGHVKGAFSGALCDAAGFVRSAEGGTLFLDEVGDLPKGAQTALLRVLQEREVIPVGATRPLPVDVRLIAATHHALTAMVAQHDFRGDLFARMMGFTVCLSALRARRDDFGILVAGLLRKVARERASSITLAPEVGLALLLFEWPFNIRELEQCLSAATTLAADGRIERSHLPSHIAGVVDAPRCSSSVSAAATNTVDADLRMELLAQLARHHGNVADVARAMGKARMQIHRWCRRFGVDANVFRR